MLLLWSIQDLPSLIQGKKILTLLQLAQNVVGLQERHACPTSFCELKHKRAWQCSTDQAGGMGR